MIYFTIICRDPSLVERTVSHGEAEALEILSGVWRSLKDMEFGGQRPKSWEDCVTWARCKWETLFNNDIRQLLHCFPPEEVKSLLTLMETFIEIHGSWDLLTYNFVQGNFISLFQTKISVLSKTGKEKKMISTI